MPLIDSSQAAEELGCGIDRVRDACRLDVLLAYKMQDAWVIERSSLGRYRDWVVRSNMKLRKERNSALMGMPDEEYKMRWNCIQELKSINDAADSLQLPYSTLSKWYHDHRTEFPISTQDAIRRNGGRRANRSLPRQRITALIDPPVSTLPVEVSNEERWGMRRPDAAEEQDVEEEGPGDSRNLVDAIFNRMQGLQSDNERLFLENRRLREEVNRLKGQLSARFDINSAGSREKLKGMLEAVTANSYGSSD